MRSPVRTILSAATFAAAVSSPALSAPLDGVEIPVPTPKPVQSYEVARIDPGVDMITTGAINDAAGAGVFAGIDTSKISVKRVADLREKRERDRFAKLDGADVEKLQGEIISNPRLVAALVARDVPINNVVFAQENADGTVTFIVL